MRRGLLPALALVLGTCLLPACDPGGEGPAEVPGGLDGRADGEAEPGDDPPYPPGTVVVDGRVGPEGGTLASDDGRVRLEVPPGALARATRLKMTSREIPTTDELAIPGASFDCEPDGTVFAKPAALTVILPADRVPFEAGASEVAVFRYASGPWHELEGSGATLDEATGLLAATAPLDHFSAYAVRVRWPFDVAPQLVSAAGEDGTVVATPAGPQGFHWAGSPLILQGSGFGYWPGRVKVRVGNVGTAVPFELQGPGRIRVPSCNDVVAAGTDAVVPVSVEVNGRPGVSLSVRFLSALGNLESKAQGTRTPSVPRGRIAILEMERLGGYPFLATVDFGGVSVSPEFILPPGERNLRMLLHVRVPGDAPLGRVGVRVRGCEFCPASEPVDIEIYDPGPPVLFPGLEAGGAWLGWVLGTNGLQVPANQNDLLYAVWYQPSLGLEVAGVPSPTPLMAHDLRIRVRTPAQDGDWAASAGPCQGQPAATCIVEPHPEAVRGVAAGDALQVQVEVTTQVVREDYRDLPPYPLPFEPLVRVSEPVEIVVKGTAIPGGLSGFDLFAVGPDSILEAPLGDTVCLSTGYSRNAALDLQAPTLWDGAIPLGAGGLRSRCLPPPSPGDHGLVDGRTGTRWTLRVKAGGVARPAAWLSPPGLTAADPSRDAVVGFGGARATIPAGTFAEPYNASAFALPAPQEGDGDPQVQSRGIRFVFGASPASWSRSSPETITLGAPISLAVPVDPQRDHGRLACFDEETGARYEPPGVTVSDGFARWVLAPGTYRTSAPERPARAWPAGTAGEGAPATRFAAGTPDLPLTPFAFTTRMGMVYRATAPGRLEDPSGRFVVDYVTDPSSPDHATEDYARRVLDTLVSVNQDLAPLGFQVPLGQVPVQIRRTLSHLPGAGSARGVTWYSRVFDSISMGISNSLVDASGNLLEKRLRTVTAHEGVHAMLRSWGGSGRTGWLDEAVAEWGAVHMLAPSLYDYTMLQEDASRPVLNCDLRQGFPDAFSGFPDTLVYGTVDWVAWFAATYGEDRVAPLVQAVYAPWLAPSPRTVFPEVAGAPGGIVGMYQDYARAFWMQSFEPVKGMDLDAMIGSEGVLQTAVFDDGAAAATLAFPALAAPLTSFRGRLLVPATGEAAGWSGADAILVGSGLGAGDRIVLWRQDTKTPRPDKAVEVGVLDRDQPVLVRGLPLASMYWAVASRGTAPGAATPVVQVAVPRVTGADRNPVKGGQPVTLTGLHFGATAGTARIGGQVATILSWSDGAVTVTAPDLSGTSAAELRVVRADGARSLGLTLPYER